MMEALPAVSAAVLPLHPGPTVKYCSKANRVVFPISKQAPFELL